jgi:hypothetical protein
MPLDWLALWQANKQRSQTREREIDASIFSERTSTSSVPPPPPFKRLLLPAARHVAILSLGADWPGRHMTESPFITCPAIINKVMDYCYDLPSTGPHIPHFSLDSNRMTLHISFHADQKHSSAAPSWFPREESHSKVGLLAGIRAERSAVLNFVTAARPRCAEASSSRVIRTFGVPVRKTSAGWPIAPGGREI